MEPKLSLNQNLLFPVLILSGFSLIILRSVDPVALEQQLIFLLMGVIFFIIFSQFNYHIFTHLSWWLYVLVVIFLSLTFFLGTTTRGSIRWIQIGQFGLQPSEFAKPLLILFASSLLTKTNIRRLPNLLMSLGLFTIPIFLIFKQPDLGSSLVVVAIVISLLIASKIKFTHSLLLTLPLLASFPFLWNFLKTYQQQRIITFLNPFVDPLGSGYNALQSMIAVGSGKLFGKGLGHGTQSQLRFLPERQTDFIFASLAEELGFVGSFIVIITYIWLLWSIISAAQKAKSQQGSLIIIGVFTMFLFQFTVNIGMNLGLFPITGITLPFISAGGSSLIASFISLGLVQNVCSSLYHPKPELELGRD